MALFGRGRRDGLEPDTGDAQHSDEQPDSSAKGPNPAQEGPRDRGPWDFEQDYPDVARIDLGSLMIPQSDRIRIQVQADPNSGTVSQLSLVTEGSAVQIQPYAAPRSGGMWDDIRSQIRSSINSSGGLVEEAPGTYGTELRAQVTNAEGKPQPARFAGVDGPRWFVRLVFLGQAARNQAAADPLEELIGEIVVVRGGEAMPMGNALPLRVPVTPAAEADPAASSTAEGALEDSTPDRPTISLPERGPEVTETR